MKTGKTAEAETLNHTDPHEASSGPDVSGSVTPCSIWVTRVAGHTQTDSPDFRLQSPQNRKGSGAQLGVLRHRRPSSKTSLTFLPVTRDRVTRHQWPF